MDETYTCDLCGGLFQVIRPEAEALAERERLWGGPKQPADAIVCDDCFKKMMMNG